MSDEPKAPETPPPAEAKVPPSEANVSPPVAPAKEVTPPPPPPPAEATASPVEAPASPPKALATGGVIDYALPPRKSYLPSPALIKNLGCLIKLVFGFMVLLLMGYFALMALNPKARAWATKGPKDGSGGPTPFKLVNQVLAIPAQALGKTDDVVKANNARVGQLDSLVAEEEAKAKGGTSSSVTDPFASPAATDKKAGATGSASPESAEGQAISRAALLALAEKNAATDPGPPAPPAGAKASPSVLSAQASAKEPAPDSPDRIALAGQVVIAHASPAGIPRASAAFFFWTVNLNVSGITRSKPARLLLNNRLAYEGDLVNRSLGITFVQLDATNQLLVFRDQSGAIVTRSY
jgi:hypothetical protein